MGGNRAPRDDTSMPDKADDSVRAHPNEIISNISYAPPNIQHKGREGNKPITQVCVFEFIRLRKFYILVNHIMTLQFFILHPVLVLEKQVPVPGSLKYLTRNVIRYVLILAMGF